MGGDGVINLEITGLERVQAQLRQLSSGQIKEAAAKALNDTAFKGRAGVQKRMDSAFERVTPYIRKSIQVERATADSLQAWVGPRMMSGGGIDPQKILQAQAAGGQRRDKRSERALAAMGVLPSGYRTVLPTDSFPSSADGRGNIRGTFLRSLLRHLSGKRKAAPKTRANRGEPAVAAAFFVLPPGLRNYGSKPPGIYATGNGRTGDGLRAVLFFVRSAAYKPRLDMDGITRELSPSDLVSRRFRYHVRSAAEGLVK